MNIQLPTPIENYLRYTRDSALEEVAALFTPEATVFDNGEDTKIVGREAIYQWMVEYTSKYKTTVEVVGVVQEQDEVVLTTLVSGNFDGSPAEFVYRFLLQEDLIDRLTIEFVGFK